MGVLEGVGGKAPRPLRVDARRNRDAIVRAARDAFETEGVLASLDGIALRAGVGNATLYRNFPAREDLLAAVMQASFDGLMAKAGVLATEHPPRRALVEWLVTMAWQLRIWHDLPQCIATARGGPGSSLKSIVSRLVGQTRDLHDRAKAEGDVVHAVEANEVFELVTALSWAIDRYGDDEVAARRRVEIATAGFLA